MKRTKFTRILSLILAFCMITGVMMPVSVFAAEEASAADEIAVDVSVVEAVSAVLDQVSGEEAVEDGAEDADVDETESAEPEEEASSAEDAVGETSEEAEPAEDVAGDEVAAEETSEALHSEEAVAADADAEEISDFETLIDCLKELETYASAYASESNGDEIELVLNFIRTGIENYNDDEWSVMAGKENTAFVSYVETMDAANGTNAMRLRNIADSVVLNDQSIEFGHMCGTMNIGYMNSDQKSADLGGWGGDVGDLMFYFYRMMNKKSNTFSGTMEELVALIGEFYFGVDEEDAFGMPDYYADMDAFYFMQTLKTGDSLLSELMEEYYETAPTEEQRAAFFLNNRFASELNEGDTLEKVRSVIYEAYSQNIALSMLEAERGLIDTNVSAIITVTDSDLRATAALRMACCSAFADYLYGYAGDLLEGTEEDNGDDEENNGDEDDTGGDSGDSGSNVGITNQFYTVFSSTKSTIAPGVTQTINYAMSADNKQLAYYIAEVDVSRDDVSIYANYKDNDPTGGWGMSRVIDQMTAAEENHSDIENFTPVVGVNADFFNMTTGQPSGALVMEGEIYCEARSENFFAILDDGSAVIGTPDEWATYRDRVVEAVGGSMMLVKNSEVVVTYSSNYYNNRASRTCVGITAEGKVILMVLDGRQEPFSAGGSAEEIAQIMLDAGCVIAMNLDGGGSTTFVAKPEGSDALECVNSPSDGYMRSVSSSLMVVSTAKSSNEFEYAKITADYSYMTVGTELELTATGVSNTGNAADIPAGAEWRVSDSTIGFVDDGVFVAEAEGSVEVQLVLDGEVVGSKKLQVVTPTALQMEKTSLTAVYGVPVEVPLLATYKGNAVAINEDDVILSIPEVGIDQPDGSVSYITAGYFDGYYFIGDESSGIRNAVCTAVLADNKSVSASIKINIYKDGEANFDFDDITAGDRTLAWKRVVSNSEITNSGVYHVVDPSQGMEVAYTFALDMTQIGVPDQLQSLLFMIAGGDDPDATAWDFLLQLAERVSVLTEVMASIQFDTDMDVDISALKIVNEYFYLKEAELDESTNVLTITCGWVDQSEPIEPATADPICIISGIKLKPSDDASWSEANTLDVVNTGEISYNIFLRANALYSFASIEENQEKYGLYPFDNQDVIIGGTTEKGASFGQAYADFEDAYVLDKTNRNGWYSENDQQFYYVANKYITGNYYLPSIEDSGVKRFYNFDEDGVCTGVISGLVEVGGKLYFAVLGEMRTGWQPVTVNKKTNYYYFLTSTGEAVNGEWKIDGYNYKFTDYVLTHGDLQYVEGKGYRYMWAGSWVSQQWIELLDGYEIEPGMYYVQKNEYFASDKFYKTYEKNSEGRDIIYILDENSGRWMQELGGLYEYNGDTYFAKNGCLVEYPGVVYSNGNYYYFNSTNKLVVNESGAWFSKVNGQMPTGTYKTDATGALVAPMVDLTGDKTLNAADLVALMKYLSDNTTVLKNAHFGAYWDSGSAEDGTKTELIADINIDGAVDILDVIALVRVIGNLG